MLTEICKAEVEFKVARKSHALVLASPSLLPVPPAPPPFAQLDAVPSVPFPAGIPTDSVSLRGVLLLPATNRRESKAFGPPDCG